MFNLEINVCWRGNGGGNDIKSAHLTIKRYFLHEGLFSLFGIFCRAMISKNRAMKRQLNYIKMVGLKKDSNCIIERLNQPENRRGIK